MSSAPTVSHSLKRFKYLVKRASLLEGKEIELFNNIPDILFERIFEKNFNGSLALAERILLNRHNEIDAIDRPFLNKRKRGIKNFTDASNTLRKSIEAGHRVIFLTDNDNDGSMAQAIIAEFLDQLPDETRRNIMAAYAQPIGKERGLNIENVDLLLDYYGWSGKNNENPILLVTADIGVNNNASVKEILKKYPNISILVTDHHLPVKDKMVEDSDRCLLFNPQVEPTDYFKAKNISGAETISLLLRNVLDEWSASRDDLFKTYNITLKDYISADRRIRKLANWSNLIDYVDADIADMPLREYVIEKALMRGSLLNTSNSMGTLIDKEFTEQDWDDLEENTDVDVQLIKGLVEKAHDLNLVAKRILAMLNSPEMKANFTLIDEKEDSEVDFGINKKELKNTQSLQLPSDLFEENEKLREIHKNQNKKSFFEEYSKYLAFSEDFPFDSANKNYISQLRPWLFRFGAVDNKQIYCDLAEDQMLQVFKELRSIEREIMEHLRNTDLMNIIHQDGVTISYSKHAGLVKFFPRKMLTKAFNEDNSGFNVILDVSSGGEWSGSMRSIYPANEIFKNKDEIEKKLGIKIEILGHAKAAGFKVLSDGTEITEKVIKDLSKEISKNIKDCRKNEKKNGLPFLDADIGTLPLINKINRVCKANLSNMNGLPVVFSLGKENSTDIAITDAKTTQQKLVSDVIKNKKYGWQPIRLNFHNDAVIISTEQLRSVVDSKFKNKIALSYMDDGAFIGQQVVTDKQIKTIEFSANRNEENHLIDYHKEHFSNNDAIPISREQLKSLPYFKTAISKNNNFELFEKTIIDVLNETQADVFSVIDVEATGLGRAPKCFNIGAMSLSINESEAITLSIEEYEKRLYRTPDGDKFLLSEDFISSLRKSSSLSAAEKKEGWFVYKNEDFNEGDLKTLFVSRQKPTPEQAIAVDNWLVDKNKETITINRRIQGLGSSFLIKNDDFVLTTEISNLTGITPNILKARGENVDVVDEKITNLFNSMKNNQGKQAKIIFSAHNLPYDKGVISSNLPKLNQLMNNAILCDTARIARKERLAYDATPTSVLDGIPALTNAGKFIYFYDSPQSSYSLTTFFERALKGINSEYPDVSGRYLLRYKADINEVSFIDKQNFRETKIGISALDLMTQHKKQEDLPLQSVKYSVERLSSRAMIRNILQFDMPEIKLVKLNESEKAYSKQLTRFQKKYNFEISQEENILNFLSDNSNLPEDILCDLSEKFINLNKDQQARFHDGWLYEKVLTKYEPELGIPISEDIPFQVAYQTNINAEKIQEIFDRTIAFKKHFKIKHGLVHEQHNNIIQINEDGIGLADTTYESVLPATLLALKKYNQYSDNIEGAREAFIEVGMRDTMRQLLIKDRHQDKAAADSYSMKQLLSYNRENATSIVELAKLANDYGWSNTDEVKFTLKTGDLPPGSGIYAKPKTYLSQDDIEMASKKLREIALYEQIRNFAFSNSNSGMYLNEAIKNVVINNNEKLVENKKWLDERFSKITFERRDSAVKKISDHIDDLISGSDKKLAAATKKSISSHTGLLAEVSGVVLTNMEIAKRINRDSYISESAICNLNEFACELQSNLEEMINNQKEAKEEKELNQLKNNEDLLSPVRSPNFLPDFDIRRTEPLNFIINQLNTTSIASILKEQDKLPSVKYIENFEKEKQEKTTKKRKAKVA